MADKKKSQRIVFLVAGGVALALVCLVVLVLKVLLSSDSGGRNRQIQQVTLLTPPPPPKIKEKEPEPEIEKKEEIIEPEMEEEPEPVEDQASDEPPPGQDLGLDADGAAGSDSFGLRAKKGARSIIGGSYSEASLLKKYAWYTRIIQEELRKKVNTHLEGNGGMPDGDLNAIVKITLDENGNILDFGIMTSSGDAKMDAAVKASLEMAQISEPPPDDMPKTIKLKISAKG
jgi:protein TonB